MIAGRQFIRDDDCGTTESIRKGCGWSRQVPAISAENRARATPDSEFLPGWRRDASSVSGVQSASQKADIMEIQYLNMREVKQVNNQNKTTRTRIDARGKQALHDKQCKCK